MTGRHLSTYVDLDTVHERHERRERQGHVSGVANTHALALSLAQSILSLLKDDVSGICSTVVRNCDGVTEHIDCTFLLLLV